MNKKPIKRIKDLNPNESLSGVRFKHNGAKWYWYSQWGYPDGKAGIWCKKDMKDTQVFPIFLDKLEEALEFEVVE